MTFGKLRLLPISMSASTSRLESVRLISVCSRSVEQAGEGMRMLKSGGIWGDGAKACGLEFVDSGILRAMMWEFEYHTFFQGPPLQISHMSSSIKDFGRHKPLTVVELWFLARPGKTCLCCVEFSSCNLPILRLGSLDVFTEPPIFQSVFVLGFAGSD